MKHRFTGRENTQCVTFSTDKIPHLSKSTVAFQAVAAAARALPVPAVAPAPVAGPALPAIPPALLADVALLRTQLLPFMAGPSGLDVKVRLFYRFPSPSPPSPSINHSI